MRKVDTVLELPLDCCGCGNCVLKCPKKCISWERKDGGFRYPRIDLNLCIDCKICEKVCPEIDVLSSEENINDVFASFTEDKTLRMKSSSGGLFGTLAIDILEQDGVVFGAAFDEGFLLYHTYIEAPSGLEPLYKSKYVESHLNNAFVKVEFFLKTGRKVLFCGTTCQCHALLKFLGKTFENLLLVDILCHGVISQEMFQKFLEHYENTQKFKVKKLVFRYKGPGMDLKYDHSFMAEGLKNGKKKQIAGSFLKFPYYRLYVSYQAFRASCYDCKFATVMRPTDLTLGDFWRLERYQKCNDLRKGYSMIIVRSEKGNEALIRVDKKIKTVQYSMQEALASNPTVSRGADPKCHNQDFIDDYERYPVSYLIKKYFNIKYDFFHRGFRFLKRILR